MAVNLRASSRLYIRGVTLPELAMFLAVLGIFVVLLPKVFNQINRSLMSASAYMSGQENAGVAMTNITHFLTSARSSTIILTAESGETPYSEIRFTTISGEDQTIFQQGSNLVHFRGSTGNKNILLKGGLQRLSFAYTDLNDPSSLQVAVTTFNTNTDKKQRVIETVTNMIRMENK